MKRQFFIWGNALIAIVRKMWIKCKLNCIECRTEIIELQIVDAITFIFLEGKVTVR